MTVEGLQRPQFNFNLDPKGKFTLNHILLTIAAACLLMALATYL